VSDYLSLSELEALGYTREDLPPTDLVGLDGAPCWEACVLADQLAQLDGEGGRLP
jgi:hypothetical protein